jgi:hypothetical protein
LAGHAIEQIVGLEIWIFLCLRTLGITDCIYYFIVIVDVAGEYILIPEPLVSLFHIL